MELLLIKRKHHVSTIHHVQQQTTADLALQVLFLPSF